MRLVFCVREDFSVVIASWRVAEPREVCEKSRSFNALFIF